MNILNLKMMKVNTLISASSFSKVYTRRYHRRNEAMAVSLGKVKAISYCMRPLQNWISLDVIMMHCNSVQLG